MAFGVPALTYGAWPFYETAWRALKGRVLSIDVPIALALSVGLAMGVSNALAGVDENYFDSLSALVFLLLLSRYFLRKLQQRGLAPSDMHFFHRQEAVTRLRSEGGVEHVHVERLKAGDLVQIAPEEMVAIDGEVTLGASHVNASLLTGESAPQAVRTGHKVFAGTQNLEGSLTVRVERTAQESRLGRILQSVEQGWNSKAPIVGLTHEVAKYFTATVFALAALYCWLHWPEGPQRALMGAITLLVVTCPCALALAIPLTFIRSLSLAAGQGLIVKGDEVLEKLARARCIVLDKTGTVTHGRVGIVDLRQTAPMPHRLVDVVWTLESSSRHPVGRALREHVGPASPVLLPVTQHQERPGVGVEGEIEGVFYRIQRGGVWTDDVCVATFGCEDRLREDAVDAVAELRTLGLSPVLLSGDRRDTVREVAQRLGLTDGEWLGEASPEEKAAFIQARPRTVMVGDGANDAVALSRADVGVAVAGAMDISLRAADAYITVPGPMPLVQLVKLARETMRVIRRNLVLSLAYNAVSVAAVYTGHITPLVAAVVMPLSSLTVLLSSVWGTRKLRRLWK